jgi:glucose-1-phosphate thymidylyltransferase
MRGVILAGGKGTRLYPLTAATNKHLIPVGRLPMIEYPLGTLRNMGIKQISIVTGGEHFTDMARYFEEVHKSVNFPFHYQREALGIPQALAFSRGSVGKEKIAVILGDNIFEDDFREAARSFEESDLGAMLFLKKYSPPCPELYFTDKKGVRRAKYGMAEVNGDKIIGLEEKPIVPKSQLAMSGLYFFDSTVFDKIKTLKISARGEYEITDLSMKYIEEGRLGFHVLDGFWSDAGTFDSRAVCESFVKKGLEKEVLKSLINSEKDDLLKKNLC